MKAKGTWQRRNPKEKIVIIIMPQVSYTHGQSLFLPSSSSWLDYSNPRAVVAATSLFFFFFFSMQQTHTQRERDDELIHLSFSPFHFPFLSFHRRSFYNNNTPPKKKKGMRPSFILFFFFFQGVLDWPKEKKKNFFFLVSFSFFTTENDVDRKKGNTTNGLESHVPSSLSFLPPPAD